MSTRARIAIVEKDRITSIFNHWDGYTKFLGAALVQKYNNLADIKKLFEKGDLETIDSEYGRFGEKIATSKPLYYDETGQDPQFQPKISKTKEELFALSKQCGALYTYIFENNEWRCYNWKQEEQELPKFETLTIQYIKQQIQVTKEIAQQQLATINELQAKLDSLYPSQS